MVVFPAPFSQVNGHLLPFQADELNPAPVDQGLVSFSRSFHQALPQPPGHTGRNLRPTPTCPDPTGTIRAEHGQLPYLLNSGLNGHIGPSGVRGSWSLASDHFHWLGRWRPSDQLIARRWASFVSPRRAKLWKTDDGPALRSGRAFARILRKPTCGYAANPTFNCRTSTSQHVGARPVRMLTARQRAASATGTTPQPRDPMPPAWQAPTRAMPAHQLRVPAVISPASMRADTAPNHPMRVRTVHPGWAHAGRQRAGWAKGAWSWRTPSGSRTPPRRTATAIGSVQGAMA
jgi:hypothetical protein